MNHLSIAPSTLGMAALLIPLTYGLVGATVSARRPFRRASLAASVGLGLSLLVSAGLLVAGDGQPLVARFSWPSASSAEFSVRLDVVTSVMLVLVCFIAAIIVRFSRTYLHGDAGQARYVRWLMVTLSAVTSLVIANNLLVLALAWTATSIAIHQLLTFYRERTQALIAAHKKFLVSRVADVCVFSALALLKLEAGSLDLDAVQSFAESVRTLPAGLELATVLLVAGVALKCAQLPFHGWLTQVMEAPTPVSALLHAGVVNIGGFLMIRLAPLMAHADLAQTLLVIVGSVTTVLAVLVMTTRVSIKVMLAWSTCAQMGFMLVQCGLGAYQLALLHLVAHSLYKAHAFLSSGSVVDAFRIHALRPAPQRTALFTWAWALPLCLGSVSAVAWAFGASPHNEPALWAFALVLSLALAPMVVDGAAQGPRSLVSVALRGAGVSALYFSFHAAFGQLLTLPVQSEQLSVRVWIVVLSFSALFVVQALVHCHPEGRLARALYPRLFAGLYLDELFTRLTFRIWPPRLPPRPALHPLHVVETQEA